MDPQRARELAADLEVSPQDFEVIRQAPFEEAVQLLEDLKLRVKKAYRRRALELHPDRTGNNLEKTERFRDLGTLLGEIEALEVTPIPVLLVPPPRRIPTQTFQASSRPSVSPRQHPVGTWVVHMKP